MNKDRKVEKKLAKEGDKNMQIIYFTFKGMLIIPLTD